MNVVDVERKQEVVVRTLEYTALSDNYSACLVRANAGCFWVPSSFCCERTDEFEEGTTKGGKTGERKVRYGQSKEGFDYFNKRTINGEDDAVHIS